MRRSESLHCFQKGRIVFLLIPPAVGPRPLSLYMPGMLHLRAFTLAVLFEMYTLPTQISTSLTP